MIVGWLTINSGLAACQRDSCQLGGDLGDATQLGWLSASLISSASAACAPAAGRQRVPFDLGKAGVDTATSRSNRLPTCGAGVPIAASLAQCRHTAREVAGPADAPTMHLRDHRFGRPPDGRQFLRRSHGLAPQVTMAKLFARIPSAVGHRPNAGSRRRSRNRRRRRGRHRAAR